MKTLCLNIEQKVILQMMTMYFLKKSSSGPHHEKGKPHTRCRNLIQLDIDEQKAYEWSNTRKGYWRISASYIFHRSLIDGKSKQIGYIKEVSVYTLKPE